MPSPGRSRLRTLLAAGLFCLAIPRPAGAAAGFEDFLNNVIKEAPTGFAALKGERLPAGKSLEQEALFFRATMIDVGMQGCQIRVPKTKEPPDYFCVIEKLSTKDFESQLKKDFEASSRRVRKCLSRGWAFSSEKKDDPSSRFYLSTLTARQRSTGVVVELGVSIINEPSGELTLSVRGARPK